MQLMPLSVKVGFAQNFEFESYDNLILKNTPSRRILSLSVHKGHLPTPVSFLFVFVRKNKKRVDRRDSNSDYRNRRPKVLPTIRIPNGHMLLDYR